MVSYYQNIKLKQLQNKCANTFVRIWQLAKIWLAREWMIVLPCILVKKLYKSRLV